MAELPVSALEMLNILGAVCKARKKTAWCRMLELAEPGYQLYHQDFGVDYFRLNLRLPFQLFVAERNNLEAIQTELEAFAREVIATESNRALHSIVFEADISDLGTWRSGENPLQASTSDVARLWKEGHFRLFLSHSSVNKEFGANLKETLAKVKVDVFVAHEDIEPNLTWQQEIKLALASCHALLFLATDTSNQSWWCQQEVGWGLGRGVLVTSYMLEKEPVGFANGLQGWKVRKHDVLEIRKKLLTMFAKDDRTEPSMHEPLVQLIQSSTTAKQIDYALDYLELLKSLSQSDLERISTVTSQPFVAKSKELKARMQVALVNFGYSPAVAATPAVDEYDPFADD